MRLEDFSRVIKTNSSCLFEYANELLRLKDESFSVLISKLYGLSEASQLKLIDIFEKYPRFKGIVLEVDAFDDSAVYYVGKLFKKIEKEYNNLRSKDISSVSPKDDKILFGRIDNILRFALKYGKRLSAEQDRKSVV